MAVPSLTLGTIGVHQIDPAAAYGVLANGGVRAETYDREDHRPRRHGHLRPRPGCRRTAARPVGAGGLLVTDILADNTDPAQNSIWGARFQLQTDEGRPAGTRRPAPPTAATCRPSASSAPTRIRPSPMAPGHRRLGRQQRLLPSPMSPPMARPSSGTTTAEVTTGGPARARLPAAGRHHGAGGRRDERPAARRPDAQHGDRDLRHLEPAGGRDTLHHRSGSRTRAQDLAGRLRRRPRDRFGAGAVYLDLVGWERDHETQERANRRWIARWRGNEAALGRSPARASTPGWRRPRPARRASSLPRRPHVAIAHAEPDAGGHGGAHHRAPRLAIAHAQPDPGQGLGQRDGGPSPRPPGADRVPRTRGWSARYSRTERRRAPVRAPCTMTASSSPASRASSR